MNSNYEAGRYEPLVIARLKLREALRVKKEKLLKEAKPKPIPSWCCTQLNDAVGESALVVFTLVLHSWCREVEINYESVQLLPISLFYVSEKIRRQSWKKYPS